MKFIGFVIFFPVKFPTYKQLILWHNFQEIMLLKCKFKVIRIEFKVSIIPLTIF